MKTIRRSIFETNSSSTHSICVSKENVDVKSLPKVVNFRLDNFGWETTEVNRADYLWTVLVMGQVYYGDRCGYDLNERRQQIETTLLNVGIESIFEDPKFDSHGCIEWGGIDHWEGFKEFFDLIFEDDQALFRYLFGDSHVYTGNDNSLDDGYDKCCQAIEEIFDDDEHCYKPNQYHNKDKYDYFFKGN